MTEYELKAAGDAFMRALEVGAPGLAEVTRKAIANNATIKLRHQFNVPSSADTGEAIFWCKLDPLPEEK